MPPTPRQNILRWSISQASRIPLFITLDAAVLPPGLTAAQTLQDFRDSYAAWRSNGGGCFNFTETSNGFGSCDVSFSSLAAVFGGAVPAATIGAITPLAAQNGVIVPDPTSSQTQFPATQIWFNKTSQFLANFTWTNSSTFPGTTSWFHFKSAATHEVGHLLGLAHCSVSQAMMYASQSARAVKTIQQADRDGIGLMCSIVPVCTTCAPTAPTNFQVDIVGQDVLVSWVPPAENCSGIKLYKNGQYISLPPTATSYTDFGAVNSLPIEYKIGAWNFYGENITAPTQVIVAPSTISSNTLWTGVIYCNSDITVSSGVRLEIGATTKVIFNAVNGYKLIVNGELVVTGIPSSPVVLKSNSATPVSGLWYGILLYG